METVLQVLPPAIRSLISQMPEDIRAFLEEIRIRESRPLEVAVKGKSVFVGTNGQMLDAPRNAYYPDREDCRHLLELLTNHSVYALEEELKRGYITVQGGHRVGLSGKAVLEKGSVKQLRDITSFNIRIARQIIGAARPLLPQIIDRDRQTVHHTLIVSPPKRGKTTLIRDLARMISYGEWPYADMPPHGLKVGIVDERSEIAACIKGVPCFDVGPRTDVLDACPKAEGMMMMVRSMSPDVLIVDEIGRAEDVEAIREALHAGIRVIATAHGLDFCDIRNRPMLREIMQEQIISRYVLLGRSYGLGRIHRIYDRSGRLISSAIVKSGVHHA